MPPKRKATKGKAFNVTAWAKSAGLSAATGTLLSQNKVSDESTLCLLRDNDISALGLSLGEAVKLRAAIQALMEPNHGDEDPLVHKKVPRHQQDPDLDGDNDPSAVANDMTGPQTTTGHSVDMYGNPEVMPPHPDAIKLRNDVRQLLQAGADLDDPGAGHWERESHNKHASGAISSDYDPRHVLTVFSPDEKALKVYDFLPKSVQTRTETRRKEAERNRRQEKKFSPVEGLPSLTVAEWEAANLRLLTHLLRTGGLCRQQVDYYLSYTVQIMEYLHHYDWQSVIAFDDRYRDLQSYHRMTWGDMRLATQLGILKPRAQQHQHRPPPQSTGPRHERPDCKQWLNSGRTRCEYGEKCKYAHRPKSDPTPQTVTKND